PCTVLPRRPSCTLFPYTTLFRSTLFQQTINLVALARFEQQRFAAEGIHRKRALHDSPCRRDDDRVFGLFSEVIRGQQGGECPDRSEEHTSELQSREDLVCRLLLE